MDTQADTDVTQDEVLLEVYSELVHIRRLLTILAVIAVVSAIFAVMFAINVADSP